MIKNGCIIKYVNQIEPRVRFQAFDTLYGIRGKAMKSIQTGGLVIATAPFDPKRFFGDWEPWKAPKDGDDPTGEEEYSRFFDGLAEVDFAEARIISVKAAITVESALSSFKGVPECMLPGGTVYAGAWKNYQERQSDSVLEYLHKTVGARYVAFGGIVLLHRPTGVRGVPSFHRYSGGRWTTYCCMLTVIPGVPYFYPAFQRSA